MADCFILEYSKSYIELTLLYTYLYDGTHQVKYAKDAYNAFFKYGDEDWLNYAQLNLATAFNNSGQFDSAFVHLNQLKQKARECSDTILMTKTYQILGLSRFSFGNYRDALDSYLFAYQLNPNSLSEYDIVNVLTAAEHLKLDSIPALLRQIMNMQPELVRSNNAPFELLAAQGRYKEAYGSLEAYKNKQDSILSDMLYNNVYGALDIYDENIRQLRNEKMKYERLLWSVVIIAILAISAYIIIVLRNSLLKQQRLREKIISNADYLRTDLLRQVEANKQASADLKELYLSKYSEIDMLCAAYYESKGEKLEQKRIVAKVENIVKEFSVSDMRISELESHANKCMNGIVAAFKQDFPKLKPEEYRFFLYQTIGFNTRCIALFLNEKIEVIYNRKSRLKAKIKNSEALRKDEYLSLF